MTMHQRLSRSADAPPAATRGRWGAHTSGVPLFLETVGVLEEGIDGAMMADVVNGPAPPVADRANRRNG